MRRVMADTFTRQKKIKKSVHGDVALVTSCWSAGMVTPAALVLEVTVVKFPVGPTLATVMSSTSGKGIVNDPAIGKVAATFIDVLLFHPGWQAPSFGLVSAPPGSVPVKSLLR
jgi:hypothetical protein